MNAKQVMNEVANVINRLKVNFLPFTAEHEAFEAFEAAIQPLFKLRNELHNEAQRVETTSHWFANAIKEIDEMIAYHDDLKNKESGIYWLHYGICENLYHVKQTLLNHAFQSEIGDENPNILQFMQIQFNISPLTKCNAEMNHMEKACTYAYNEGFKAAMAAVELYLAESGKKGGNGQ